MSRSSTLNVTTEGTFITDVDLTTLIEHTSSGDLDILLRFPVGTEVIISTDNGGAFNDVFNGTRWDDQANALVTEHPFNFTSNAPVTTLTPEDALSAFKGEDPNGIWTLEVSDNVANAETGLLNGWSLDLEAVGQPVPPVPGPGDDVLKGTDSDNVLNGLEGDDKLIGRAGNDNLIGGEGDDKLRGNGGKDTLDGGEGNDNLIGGGGSDQLAGGNDDDLLKGGGGRDTLNGGEGRDTLIGGGGRDVFVIGDGNGRDLIKDYRDGKDQIELSGSLGFSDLDIFKRGRNALIRVGREDIAIVRRTSVNELTVADFI